MGRKNLASNGANIGYEAQLWQMADALRGSIDAAEYTVDGQHCADAIIDAVEVIEHCFPGAKAALPDKLKVTLRVVRLFSQHGDGNHQREFGDAMQRYQWRGTRERARQDEIMVAPGLRANWGLVIPSEYARVETVLNRVGVPPF